MIIDLSMMSPSALLNVFGLAGIVAGGIVAWAISH